MYLNADDDRFRRIFAANLDAIQAYCHRRLPVGEAADAVSEVFLITWRRIAELPDDDAVRLWLFGVARNVVSTMSRTSRRRFRAITRAGGMAATRALDPETQVVAAIEYREIMAAFDQLSSTDQEVLRLRLWEELSVGETAAILDTTAKAASKRYQRALSRLTRATAPSPIRRIGPQLELRGGER